MCWFSFLLHLGEQHGCGRDRQLRFVSRVSNRYRTFKISAINYVFYASNYCTIRDTNSSNCSRFALQIFNAIKIIYIFHDEIILYCLL